MASHTAESEETLARSQGCTLGCEEGPFLTTDAPEVPSGSTIALPGTTGEKMHFSATIKNTKGQSIPGAKVEVVRITSCRMEKNPRILTRLIVASQR